MLETMKDCTSLRSTDDMDSSDKMTNDTHLIVFTDLKKKFDIPHRKKQATETYMMSSLNMQY